MSCYIVRGCGGGIFKHIVWQYVYQYTGTFINLGCFYSLLMSNSNTLIILGVSANKDFHKIYNPIVAMESRVITPLYWYCDSLVTATVDIC